MCPISAPTGTLVNMSGLGRQTSSLLERLARLYGLETGYRDSRGTWREAAPHTVMALLRALGADLESAAVGAGTRGPHAETRRERALRGRRGGARAGRLGGRLLEPVLLAWDGRPASAGRSASWASRAEDRDRAAKAALARLTLRLEDGSSTVVDLDLAQFAAPAAGTAPTREHPGRRTYRISPFGLGRPAVRGPGGPGVPPGRRRGVPGSGREGAAPRVSPAHGRGSGSCERGAGHRCSSAVLQFARTGPWRPSWGVRGSGGAGAGGVSRESPAWGVFAPVYALRSERDWGAGDLDELAEPGPAGTQGRRFVRGHVCLSWPAISTSLRTGTLSARKPPLLERVLPSSRKDPGIRVLRKSAASLGFILLPGATQRP